MGSFFFSLELREGFVVGPPPPPPHRFRVRPEAPAESCLDYMRHTWVGEVVALKGIVLEGKI
jgi:hypothetical protein